MDDPVVMAIVVGGVIALSIGASIGWFVRKWAYGCVVICMLLFVAVGVLIYLFTEIWPLKDDWNGIAFLFFLFVILILWSFVSAGWLIALTIRRNKEERPS